MTTETLDRLYLELSLVSKARTKREIEMDHEITLTRQALGQIAYGPQKMSAGAMRALALQFLEPDEGPV